MNEQRVERGASALARFLARSRSGHILGPRLEYVKGSVLFYGRGAWLCVIGGAVPNMGWTWGKAVSENVAARLDVLLLANRALLLFWRMHDGSERCAVPCLLPCVGPFGMVVKHVGVVALGGVRLVD